MPGDADRRRDPPVAEHRASPPGAARQSQPVRSSVWTSVTQASVKAGRISTLAAVRRAPATPPR